MQNDQWIDWLTPCKHKWDMYEDQGSWQPTGKENYQVRWWSSENLNFLSMSFSQKLLTTFLLVWSCSSSIVEQQTLVATKLDVILKALFTEFQKMTFWLRKPKTRAVTQEKSIMFECPCVKDIKNVQSQTHTHSQTQTGCKGTQWCRLKKLFNLPQRVENQTTQ